MFVLYGYSQIIKQKDKSKLIIIFTLVILSIILKGLSLLLRETKLKMQIIVIRIQKLLYWKVQIKLLFII